MSILKITDTPERDKYESAFLYLKENLTDYMNESKGSELRNIIDNYLVNHDYVTALLEYYKQSLK